MDNKGTCTRRGAYRGATLVTALVMVATVSACDTRGPAEVLTPTFAGVIATQLSHFDNVVEYRLEDGSTASFDLGTRRVLRSVPDSEPQGELLLAGEDGSRPWVAGFFVDPANTACWLYWGTAVDDGKYIKTAMNDKVGLRLRKAPGFRAAGAGLPTKWGGAHLTFCLNEQGEVVSDRY